MCFNGGFKKKPSRLFKILTHTAGVNIKLLCLNKFLIQQKKTIKICMLIGFTNTLFKKVVFTCGMAFCNALKSTFLGLKTGVCNIFCWWAINANFRHETGPHKNLLFYIHNNLQNSLNARLYLFNILVRHLKFRVRT